MKKASTYFSLFLISAIFLSPLSPNTKMITREIADIQNVWTDYPTLSNNPSIDRSIQEIPSQVYVGDLDPSFGINGIVTTTLSFSKAYLEGMAVQSDGKIVVAGTMYSGSSRDFLIIRYLVDGSLDPDFGNNGMVLTDIGTDDDIACDMAIQDDGKIIVVGGSDRYPEDGYLADQIAVVRYNEDGSLDTTFGDSDGIVLTALHPNSHSARTVEIQQDNNILVGGGVDSGGVILRYTPDGSLDEDFGNGAGFFYVYGNPVEDIKQQGDGKIVFVSSLYAPLFIVGRLNIDGSYDLGFGSTGYVATNIRDLSSQVEEARSESVDIKQDGKIVVAGRVWGDYYYSTTTDLAIIQYTPDGNLDSNFGDGSGFIIDDIGGIDTCRDMVVQSDGKILLTGGSNNYSDQVLFLARYNSSGSRDPNFGNNGVALVEFERSGEWKSVALYPGDRIVVAGEAVFIDGYKGYILARFLGRDPLPYDVELSSYLSYTYKMDNSISPAYSPSNVTVVKSCVYNVGTESVYGNVILREKLNQSQLGSANYGSAVNPILPGGYQCVAIDWAHVSSYGKIEDLDIEIIANIDGHSDEYPNNNTISDRVSVYWSDFQVGEDSYNFSNPGYTIDMLFDDIVTLRDHLPTLEYGLIMAMLLKNFVIESGHCFGMSATSVLYYQAPDIIPGSYNNTYQVPEQEATNIVRKYQRNQVMIQPFIDPPENNWGQYDDAASLISVNEPPQLLLRGGLFQNHAVVAYKAISSSKDRRIFIYENNNPDSPDIGFISNTGAFLYGSYNKFFVNQNLNLLLDDALAKEILDAFREWSIDQGLGSVFVGSPVETVVINSSGQRLGYVNGSLYTEIPNGYLWEVAGETFFALPKGSYSVQMTGLLGIDPNSTADFAYGMPNEIDGYLEVAFENIPVQAGEKYETEVSSDSANVAPITMPEGDYLMPDRVDYISNSQSPIYMPFIIR